MLLASSLFALVAALSSPLAQLVSAGTVSPTHFVIETPSKTSPWKLDSPNPLVWKTAKEGILQFDVELVRLSGTGLLLVSKNVPVADGHAVVDTQGIAAGDDYFAVFMDSYDGHVYARSSKFSIQSNNTASTSVAASLTMTITGAPNPTRAFETTLPALVTTSASATPASFYGAPSTPDDNSAAFRTSHIASSLALGGAFILGGALVLV